MKMRIIPCQFMRKVTLFLDFDGVTHPLHCHESRHFSCLSGIEDVLRQVPSVEVVISSTWRLQYPMEALRARFSANIAQRVIGVTPIHPVDDALPVRLLSFPRHAECVAWMRTNRQSHDVWLAIDDRPYLFEPFFMGVVVTESWLGATGDVLQKLKHELERLASRL